MAVPTAPLPEMATSSRAAIRRRSPVRRACEIMLKTSEAVGSAFLSTVVAEALRVSGTRALSGASTGGSSVVCSGCVSAAIGVSSTCSSIVTTSPSTTFVRVIIRVQMSPFSSVYSSSIVSMTPASVVVSTSSMSWSTSAMVSSSTVSAAITRAPGNAPVLTKAAPVSTPETAFPALITTFFTSADNALSFPVTLPSSISASRASPSGFSPTWKVATIPKGVSVAVSIRATGSI